MPTAHPLPTRRNTPTIFWAALWSVAALWVCGCAEDSTTTDDRDFLGADTTADDTQIPSDTQTPSDTEPASDTATADTHAPDTTEPPDTFLIDAPDDTNTPNTNSPDTSADDTFVTPPDTFLPDATDDTSDAPDPDPYTGTACQAGDLIGTCQWTWNCAGAMQSVSGFCPGPRDMQCCVPESTDPYIGTACAVNGTPGTCLDTADCTGEGLVSTSGYCPGPSNVQCCTETPSSPGDACDLAAHPTPNDGLLERPGDPGCPSGMIAVTSTLCVDQFEGALMEVLSDGSERSWSPYFNPGTRTMRAVSLEGAVPQGYINGTQASAACQQAGKRLCSNTEWLRACRGPDSTTFPYGNTLEPGVCNDARSQHPAVEYFGSSESWVFSHIDHQCINQLPDSLALTGSHPGCITTEGALDMMGNLHEWTSDSAGTFRGGFYVDTYRNGPGCLYATTAHDTSHWDYSTGFRCCADRQ